MPTVLIRNFPTLAASPDANDFIALDGSSGVTDRPAFSNVADSRGNVRFKYQNV